MKKLIIEIAASLLVILFIYAGVNKLINYSEFRFQLGRSPYLASMSGLIAWLMPSIEIIVALLLTAKKTRLIGFYGSFLIMVLFTGYIYAMLHFSPYLPCSCGGVLALMTWDQHLSFNLFFVLLSAIGVLILAPTQQTNKIETA